MQFLTFEQANMQPFREEYRYSLATSFIALVSMIVVVAACAVGAVKCWNEKEWTGLFILGWCALWFGLFGLFVWMIFNARRLPTNWLVRLQTGGLLIKYRTYLNHHFPPQDTTVVYVPFSEIEWVREHRVQRNVPGGTLSDDTPSRAKYAEFKLGDELVLELDKRLTAERLLVPPKGSKWLGGGRSRSQHYPLMAVRGGFARVEWGVRPKLRAFLNEIRPFVTVKPALGSAVDFRTITELPKEEQEQHLLELIEIGDRIGAIKVAKRLYKFNTTKAVQFIDELSAHQSNKF